MTLILFSSFMLSYGAVYAKTIRRNSHMFFLITALCFIFVSAFRPQSGWGADTVAYVSAYSEVLSNPNISTEITFKLIANLVYKLGNSVTLLFFIYAVLAVSIKRKVIESFSVFPLFSWLMYLSCWFILHDMYQIRVGASIAFFMFSLMYLQDRNLRKYLFCAVIAVLFHTQALILIPLYLIGGRRVSGKTVFVYDFILLLSYAFYFFKIDVLSIFLLGLTKIKIPRAEQLQYYYVLSQAGIIDLGKINAFSPIVLVRLFLTLFLLHGYKYLNDKPLYPVCIRISVVSFAVRMFFYAIPVIGMRVYEYLSVVEIFLFPLFFVMIKEKKIIHILLFVYCMFFILLRLRTA